MFEIYYGIREISPNYKVVTRKAVKGIVIVDRKVLFIHTNKGDYKFPGGGIQKEETTEQALSREIMEETGYKLSSIGDVICKVKEVKLDQYEKETYFIMESLYVSCEVDFKNQFEMKLDKYEKEQDFKPVFVEINEAIKNNNKLLEECSENINPWVLRETDVLRAL